MSVPQAVVLLAFNSNDRLTIGQLAELLGLSFEYVCSCLKAFLELKILKTSATNVSFYLLFDYEFLNILIMLLFSVTFTHLKQKSTLT
jgi:DNA-binding Lrp family transcriptional regulator